MFGPAGRSLDAWSMAEVEPIMKELKAKIEKLEDDKQKLSTAL